MKNRNIRTTSFAVGFLITLLVVNLAAQSEDVPGWQDARWGMKETELVERFGAQLTKLAKPDQFKDAFVNYVITPYEIESGKYTVHFQMNKESLELDQILIRLNQMESAVPNDIYFNQLDSLLTRKYGTPKWKNDNKAQSSYNLSRQWVFPTTCINLEYSWSHLTNFNLLTLRYYPTKKSTLTKV